MPLPSDLFDDFVLGVVSRSGKTINMPDDQLRNTKAFASWRQVTNEAVHMKVLERLDPASEAAFVGAAQDGNVETYFQFLEAHEEGVHSGFAFAEAKIQEALDRLG